MTKSFLILVLITQAAFTSYGQTEKMEAPEIKVEKIMQKSTDVLPIRVGDLKLDYNTLELVQSCCQPVQVQGKSKDDTDITDPELSGITTFPNPTRGDVSLKLSANLIGQEIQIIDMTGRVVAEPKRITSQTESLTIEGEAGVYLILVRTESETITSRIILDK